jgi:hypothetical protein
MQMRECRRCKEIKYVTLSFTAQSRPNTCKDCLSKAQQKGRRTKGSDPARHWKKSGFRIKYV